MPYTSFFVPNMSMKSIQLPPQAVIAHRGASHYAPENTLAAFRFAVEQGADGIEFDVKLSADGHPIIIHDATVDRTTNGTGKVSELTLNELRTLDAGSWFGKSYAGEPIPTLGEVLDTVGHDLILNIELTNYTTPRDALPEIVADTVEKHNMTERVFFTSFHPRTVSRIAKRLPNVPRGLLLLPTFAGKISHFVFGKLLPLQTINPEFQLVSPGFVKKAHQRERKVFPYTINAKDDILSALMAGVDGIITDDPILAQKVRNSL